jgi:hypothetical protein
MSGGEAKPRCMFIKNAATVSQGLTALDRGKAGQFAVLIVILAKSLIVA